jgi:16S rRNA (guanine1516-N2)-methyltransferase
MGAMSFLPCRARSDMIDEHSKNDLVIDFVGGAVGYRLRSGEGRGQALPRAVGFGKGIVPNIVDATAGLGRDAFLLASLGAQVTLIERSSEMHARLHDAMARANAAGGRYAETIARMTLLHGDSIQLLPTLTPDVVLVDPMHPPRHNTALVKKEMRILREIVGTDEDQIELMCVALGCAKKRVVLKWPLRAEPMAGIRKPSHQILGKNTRYDVFMIAS